LGMSVMQKVNNLRLKKLQERMLQKNVC
jgi:hypothetical protein